MVKIYIRIFCVLTVISLFTVKQKPRETFSNYANSIIVSKII